MSKSLHRVLPHFVLNVFFLLLVLFTGKAFSQYQVIYTGNNTQWSVPIGVDSIMAGLWGPGHPNGYVGTQGLNPQEPSLTGGGGAYAQSKAIAVNKGQVFFTQQGYCSKTWVGSGYGDNINYSPTIFGPFPDGSYDTAYGGDWGTGGRATTGPYILYSFAGGNGVSEANNSYGRYSGAGAAGNLYGPGANGSAWQNSYNGNAPNGAGQYGAGSGAYGQGYYYYDGGNDQYYDTSVNYQNPGGGGGSLNGGNGAIRLGVHFTNTISYKRAGTYTWTVPAGVTTIYVELWGGGAGGNGSQGGGGGGFTQSKAINVSAGNIVTVTVGGGGGSSGGSGGNSTISVNGNIYCTAYGATAGSGGQAEDLIHGFYNYEYFSFGGGNGSASAGGAAANPFAGGLPGGNGVGGVGYFFGGSGGAGSQNGVWPGGGGGYSFGNGADGAVFIGFSCDASAYTASIGNGHAVAYPPEMVPDSVKVISSNTAATLIYQWQYSKDGSTWAAAATQALPTAYLFSKDSIGATTYYRLTNNACFGTGGFGNASNVVTMRVLTSADGRNGHVTGFVQTRTGTSIHDRKVFAKSLTPLKGRKTGFLDSVLTDQQGRFSFDSLFYGDRITGDSASVRFLIYPDTVGGRRYSPASASITLSAISPNYDLTGKPFKDTTLLSVTGQVYQVCTGCLDNLNNVTSITSGLDGVFVRGLGANPTAINPEKDSTITGYHNPPGKYGNYGLNFQEPDSYTITPSYYNHKFIPAKKILTLTTSTSGVDFQDTATHLVSGYFSAGCRDSIGKITLEFDDVLKDTLGNTRPSELRKRITTGAGGYYSIRLPARKYKVKIVAGTINDPVDASLNFSTVLSFFGALPADSLTANLTTADTVLNLIYKRAPQVQVTGIVDTLKVLNCAPANRYKYAVWPQGDVRQMSFDVYQGPVSKGCMLNEGVVQLQTDIPHGFGKYDYDTLTVINGHATLSLRAGEPNTLLNPATNTYSKYLFATYTDLQGRSLSTADTARFKVPYVIITGVSVDPSAQTFLTVTPQLPFMVLHDPPGNASSSTWSAGSSSSQSLSFNAAVSASDKLSEQIKVGEDLIEGIGVEVESKVFADLTSSFQVTAKLASNNEIAMTTTTNNTISTANNNNGIGPDADIFYGAAMNIKYAVGTEIDYDSIQCKFATKNVMVFAPTGLSTTFIYTLAQIRDVQIPKLILAAQTKPDSAAFFMSQVKVWQQVLDNNKANLEKAPIDSNISFSSQTSFTHTVTHTSSSTNAITFDLAVETSLALQLGFEIGGNGANVTDEISVTMNAGGGITFGSQNETTTGYTLTDDNNNSLFSVNLKTDPVYGSQMFETVAGESTCPAEPGTIALDSMVLTVPTPVQKNITSDTANFVLYLGNLSIDPGAREYVVFLNAASNPDGATVLIGGTSAPDGVGYIIPKGGTQKITVSVIRNSASGVFNYDNLQIIASDNCFAPNIVSQFLLNNHQSSSVLLTADFTSKVSGVNLVTPANNWLVGKAANNGVSVKFNGYDTSKLQTIAMEYVPVGSANWQTAFTNFKTSLGSSATGTTSIWNIANIPDGSYNVRLVVQDKFNNIIYSPIATGTIDRTAPSLFGVPKPSANIYKAGSQISFSYTENINGNAFNSNTATITDVTTNTQIPSVAGAYNNTVAIVPSVNLTQYNGHIFRTVVKGISDLNGNVKALPDTSYFTVGATTVSTGTDALNVTIGTSSLPENSGSAIDVHFKRNAKATGPIVIYYSIGGTASLNNDFTLTYSGSQSLVAGITGTTGTIILPKDSTSITLYIHPVADTSNSNKTLTITLADGGGYSIGSNYAVTATFTNVAAALPTITSFTPTTAGNGTTVTITGTNLTGVSAVNFGGVAAKSFTVISSTSIQAVVATGATGSISVTAPGGTGSLPGFTFCTPVTPSVTIAANIASPICTGTKVTFTATPVNGGSAPTYQWYKNNVVVGTASKYADSLLKNSDSVWCVLTSNAACVTTNKATSSKLKYAVNALIAPSVTIAANIASPICTGTKVTFTAMAVNGGTAPTYQWYKNNVAVGASSTYIDSLLKNSDSVWCVLTSNAACATTNKATSSKLKYAVNALIAPSVNIAANIASPICTGTKVTFTATPVNGGTTPTYQWYKNNVAVGASSTYIDSLLKNSDSVWCVLTSNSACATTATATSSKLKYTVNALIKPSVTIAANIASPICAGIKVTFTAKAVNGGTVPAYQWYKNNVVVGTAITYTDSLLKNSDSIWCVLTSNAACTVTKTATSNKLKYIVNAMAAPSVTIAANIASPICIGTIVIFTATPVNGGASPVYQWYKNNVVVSSAATYTDSLLNNNDSVWCVLTSNAACITTTAATSSKLKYTVNTLAAPSLTIAANIASPVCTGTKVTFTATPVNGGASPVYQWYKNSVVVGSAATYTDSLLKNNDSIWCVLTSNAACITTTAAISSKLKYTVNALAAPSVTITANIASPVCTGTKVTFTAKPVNGGTAPTYQWYKNNVVVGTASTYTDSLLKNNDSIWCVLTSKSTCITTSKATSSKLKYIVNTGTAISVTISASPGKTLCYGTKDIFTAVAINAGTTPAYQWYRNNSKVGSSSAVYNDSMLKGGDSVWVIASATTGCGAASATSNKITIVQGGSAQNVAYIPNGYSKTVSVVNINTGKLVATVPLGIGVGGVSVTPDSKKVYFTNSQDNTVSVLSTATNTIIKTISGFGSPQGVVVSPDGSKAYVVNGSGLLFPEIMAINVSADTIIPSAAINGGLPGLWVSITPDGKKLYVANQTNSISVLSTTTNSLIKTISMNFPWGITVSPDSKKAYVSNYNNNTVSVINASADTLMAVIPVGTNPVGLAASPDGSKVYVTNTGSSSIGIINTTTNTVAGTIAVDNGPYGIGITPDGGTLVTANDYSNTASIVSTATNSLTSSVGIGGSPLGLGNFIASLPSACPVLNPAVSITANAPGVLCANTKVTFTAAAVNGGSVPAYQWYKNSKAIGSNTNTYLDSLLKTGDSVWCVLTSNAAPLAVTTAKSNVLTFTVSTVVTPSVTIVSSVASPICVGTKVSFTATVVNGGTAPVYQWYKNNTVVGSSSIYTDSLLKNSDSVWCVVTGNANCTAGNTAKSNRLYYTVNLLPVKPTLTQKGVTSFCLYDSLILTATVAPGTLQWYRNNGVIKQANASRYAVKVAGSYKLLLTGSNGCSIMSDSVIATVTQVPRPAITLVNDTLVSSSATGNQWYENGVTIPGATGKTFAPINIDAYTLQVSNAGCLSPMSDPFIYTAGTFFMANTKGRGTYGASALIYPNPAGSIANLKLNGFKGGVIVTIMDMAGRVVWQEDKLFNSTYQLPLSNLAQGSYIVIVKDRTTSISLKLIKGETQQHR